MRNPYLIIRLIGILVLCHCGSFIFADQLVPVTSKDVETECALVGSKLLMHIDKGRNDAIGKVMNMPLEKWQKTTPKDFEKNQWRRGKTWFAFRLVNDSKTDSLVYYLEIGRVDALHIYSWENQLMTQKAGAIINYNDRAFPDNQITKLVVPPNTDITYYANLKLKVYSPKNFKFNLISEKYFHNQLINELPNSFYKIAVYGFFYGILLLLILFSAINYKVRKDKIYLIYLFYLVSLFVYYQLLVKSFNPTIFGHILENTAPYARAFILGSSGLYLLFVRQFLGITKEHYRITNLILLSFAGLIGIIALTYAGMVFFNVKLEHLHDLYYTTRRLLFPVAMIFCSYVLYAFRDQRINWYIIFGSIALVLMMNGYTIIKSLNMPIALSKFHMIEDALFLSLGQIGVLIEIVLFYIGLTMRSRLKLNQQKAKTIAANEKLTASKIDVANKEKEIAQKELTAIKSKVNPHFISNALMAINSLIMEDKKKEANFYLVKFSRMMRAILDQPEEALIPLEDELTFCQLYLELESLRFDNEFTYTIETNNIDTNFIKVPSMILHPYLENAIKHGLRNKEGEKILKITLSHTDDNTIKCSIDDNGIGRQKALKIKQKNNSLVKSHGIKINNNIISNSNKIYGTGLRMNIIDKNIFKNETGTIVELEIPI